MIPERRILVYVAAMITGIILVMRYDAVRKLPQLIQSHKVEYQNVQSPNLLSHYVAELSVTTIAAAAIVLMIIVLMIIVLAFIVLSGGPMKAGRSIIFRSGQSRLSGGWWRDIGLSVLLAGFWFLAGIVAAILQLAQMPDLWQGSSGTSLTLSGTVEQVDGRSSDRLRLWVRVDADPSSDTTSGPIQGPIPDSAPLPSAVAGYLARLSIDAGEAAITTPDGIRNVLPGDRLQLAARIYPSPPPVFYGAPDHARQARAKDVVASGYLTQPPRYLGTADGLSYRLARYRQIRADIITDGMSAPQGGIAAALLIGDRRHVDDATYDMFRFSGLAHLLAISGLHMGLLCFGVIGFARGVMAIMPGVAVRLPVHKYAALTGLMAAALYVVLSGASISASRAFLMAVLIILAILSDRLALTLRNVAIAALVLLAVNPLALFTAGFQMSFAATAALVIRFENYAGGPRSGWRLWRWFRELVIASVIASLATLPFTAQHFGLVTPWGVVANLIGIPLTGLWIMPAGLTVLATQLLPVPQMIADICLWVMQVGIGWLVAVATWFSERPYTPIALPPPGSGWLYAGFILTCCCLVVGRHGKKEPQARLRGANLGDFSLRGASIVAVLVMIAFWVIRPVPDAVLFARTTSQLVIAVDAVDRAGRDTDVRNRDGDDTAFAFSSSRRALSDFLAGNAARVLGVQAVIPARTGWFREIAASGGHRVNVVLHRGALSDACSLAYGKAEHAQEHDVTPEDNGSLNAELRDSRSRGMVLALVAASYPCGGGVPLFSITGMPAGNYLVWLPRRVAMDTILVLQNSAGQYFRINPVSRP